MSNLTLPDDPLSAYQRWIEEEKNYKLRIGLKTRVLNPLSSYSSIASTQILLDNVEFWKQHKILNVAAWKYLLHRHFTGDTTLLAIRILCDVLDAIEPALRQDKDLVLLSDYTMSLSNKAKNQILNIGHEQKAIASLGFPSRMSYLFMTCKRYSEYLKLLKLVSITEKSLNTNVYHQLFFDAIFDPLRTDGIVRSRDTNDLRACITILVTYVSKIESFDTLRNIFKTDKYQLAFLVNSIRVLRLNDNLVVDNDIKKVENLFSTWFSTAFPQEFKTFNILESLGTDISMQDMVYTLINKDSAIGSECELPTF